MAKKVPLNHVVHVSEVNEAKFIEIAVEATAEECASLRAELDIIDVKQFAATLKVQHTGGALYRVTGRVRADVVQACSVNLTPVDEQIDEAFDEMLTTDVTALVPEEEFEANTDTPVDVITDDKIDAGEILTQWLALSLNPYPRSDAPIFQHLEDADSAEGKQTYSPFKALAALKDK